MDLALLEYKPTMATLWDDFVMHQSVNGTVFHTRNFINYHPPDRFTDRSILIKDYKKDKLICVVPVCEKGDGFFSYTGSSYGGPVIHPSFYTVKCLDQLLPLILDHFNYKLGMRLAPSIFGRCLNDPLVYWLGRTHQVIRELSVYQKLDQDDFIGMIARSSTRSSVRSLLRQGFMTEAATIKDDYQIFHEMLTQNLTHHDVTPTHSLDELLNLRERLGDQQVLVLGRDKSGEIVSGTWVIKASRQSWHTFYIAKDYEYKHHAAMPCALLKAMTLAKQNGAKYLNFGICTEDRGQNMNISLFDFKESLGGETINRYVIEPYEP